MKSLRIDANDVSLATRSSIVGRPHAILRLCAASAFCTDAIWRRCNDINGSAAASRSRSSSSSASGGGGDTAETNCKTTAAVIQWVDQTQTDQKQADLSGKAAARMGSGCSVGRRGTGVHTCLQCAVPGSSLRLSATGSESRHPIGRSVEFTGGYW